MTGADGSRRSKTPRPLSRRWRSTDRVGPKGWRDSRRMSPDIVGQTHGDIAPQASVAAGGGGDAAPVGHRGAGVEIVARGGAGDLARRRVRARVNVDREGHGRGQAED